MYLRKTHNTFYYFNMYVSFIMRLSYQSFQHTLIGNFMVEFYFHHMRYSKKRRILKTGDYTNCW